MKRWAFLAVVTLVSAGAPSPTVAQKNPPTPTQLNDQVAGVRQRVGTNGLALQSAAEKCDLEKLRSLVAEALALLNQSNQLLDAVQADPDASLVGAKTTNADARRNYNRALVLLAETEEKCGKTPKDSGGVGPAATPATPEQPTLPPPFGFDELWADAMKAFQAHYGHAQNCDLNRMRAERAKLEIYARDAEKRASKLRRAAFNSSDPRKKADAEAGSAYAKAIEALWQQALLQPPLNCPKTGVAAQQQQQQQEQQQQQKGQRQQQQQFPANPEQQQQQEVRDPDPRQTLLDIYGLSGAADSLHKIYVRNCNKEGEQSQEAELDDLAKEAKAIADAAKAAGDLSTVSPGLAQAIATEIARRAAAAKARTPENCGQPGQPQGTTQTGSSFSESSDPRIKDIVNRMRVALALNQNLDNALEDAEDLVDDLSAGGRFSQTLKEALDLEREIKGLIADRKRRLAQPQQQQQQQQRLPETEEQHQQQEVPAQPKYGLRFTPPDPKSQRFLARINYWRRDAGMTPLIWDRDLAASAQARGAELARTGLMHRPRTGPRPVGENLLQNLPGQRSIEQMIDVWGNEKRYFTPGIFPNVSTTGDWSAVGHYTQMVWGGSQWIGCATSANHYEWTICHFYPVGNKDGKAVFGPKPRDLIPFIRPRVTDVPESP